MIWFVLFGILGLALVVYFAIERVREKKARTVCNHQDHVFYKHVLEINLKNQDGTNRQEIIRCCNRGEELLLVLEPDNPHDSDAVKVCRKNGQQIGYLPTDNGRMARDLATGWTFRTTVDDIYPFEENPQNHGIRLRMEVLAVSQNRPRESRNQPASA